MTFIFGKRSMVVQRDKRIPAWFLHRSRSIAEVDSDGRRASILYSWPRASLSRAKNAITYYFRLLPPWPFSASSRESCLVHAQVSVFKVVYGWVVQLSVSDKIAMIHYIAPYLLWVDCASFILILYSTYHIFVISHPRIDDTCRFYL